MSSSGFDLVPVDDGGVPVHLPPGETVLGRGPLLGVTDKRVSRRHGVLEIQDGCLRLKPIHLNPCFVQSSLTDDPRPLEKDSWHLLNHGDFFSLLPGQFIYKVVAVGEAEHTPRNSQIFEDKEEEEHPISPELDVEPDRGRTPPHELTSVDPSNEGKDDDKGDPVLPKEVQDHSDVAAPGVKKRVLPMWMMAAVATLHASSCSTNTVQSPVRRNKTAAGASTSTGAKRAAAKKATPTATSVPDEVGQSEEEEEDVRPRKKRRKISEEEEKDEDAQSKTDIHSEEPTLGQSEVEEEEKGETSTSDRNTTMPRASDRKLLKNGRQTNKGDEQLGSIGGSAASKPQLRTPCPYGKDCYRKNPVHFQECSHPGDTDYEEEEEEEEEADRPECPYGTDCYRKNPLHRKEFKHTKRPARTTRAKNSHADEDGGDEEEDDDSFINDDSEDAGDDSDYLPPDSDDSGKEDVKRLQREAKVFLKRKK